MYKLIGYVLGIILFFALGIAYHHEPIGKVMLAFAILNIITIGLTIIYRVLCSCFQGFRITYHNYLQGLISSLAECLTKYTVLEQYKIITTTIHKDGSVSVQETETCNNCICAFLEITCYTLSTFLVPVYLLIILYCYVLGTINQCMLPKDNKPVQPRIQPMQNVNNQQPVPRELNEAGDISAKQFVGSNEMNDQIPNQNQIPSQVPNKNDQIPNQNLIASEIVINPQVQIHPSNDKL